MSINRIYIILHLKKNINKFRSNIILGFNKELLKNEMQQHAFMAPLIKANFSYYFSSKLISRLLYTRKKTLFLWEHLWQNADIIDNRSYSVIPSLSTPFSESSSYTVNVRYVNSIIPLTTFLNITYSDIDSTVVFGQHNFAAYQIFIGEVTRGSKNLNLTGFSSLHLSGHKINININYNVTSANVLYQKAPQTLNLNTTSVALSWNKLWNSRFETNLGIRFNKNVQLLKDKNISNAFNQMIPSFKFIIYPNKKWSVELLSRWDKLDGQQMQTILGSELICKLFNSKCQLIMSTYDILNLGQPTYKTVSFTTFESVFTAYNRIPGYIKLGASFNW